MRRGRYQKGSLQLRKRGRRRMWCVLFYLPSGKRGYHALGLASEMTKSQARGVCDAYMREHVNGGDRENWAPPPPTVRQFLVETYLPFYRGKWKGSTRETTEQRLNQHVLGDLGALALESLSLAQLQAFLQSKADANLSKSIVDHLRFDLRAIFRMALAAGIIAGDPTPALYSPRVVKLKNDATMSRAQVVNAIAALPQREALMLHLTLLVGMRPGEMMALQRRHVSADCQAIQIDQRVYGGVIDAPKTPGSRRGAAIAPETAALLAAWLQDAVDGAPEAYVFASEAGTPLRPGNVIRRIIRPALRKIGLEWFNFQVARRTHASLGHDIDAKVMADQRGHGIGVALDTYTKSSPEDKAKAARKLAKKVLRMPPPLKKESA
jgi:integrase